MDLPVRCCCTPALVLGVVGNLDRSILETRTLTVSAVRPFSAKWIEENDVGHLAATATLRTEQYFDDAGGWEFAIKSEDRPLEFWRELPNFRELNYPLQYVGTWRVWDEILSASSAEALGQYKLLLEALENRMVFGDPKAQRPRGLMRG